MEERKNTITGISFAEFSKAKNDMVGSSTASYEGLYNEYYSNNYLTYKRKYTPEELIDIIDSGSLETQQSVSEQYYQSNGYYQQFINYYATLLKYAGILIPNANGKSLSSPHILKRYNNAMDYVDKMNLPIWLAHCARRALIYGTYYGLRVDLGKKQFGVVDLPVRYCKTEFRDPEGNDIIQFNVGYFSTISNKDAREEIIKLYPPIVQKQWKAYEKKRSASTAWVIIPTEFGICFTLFDGKPLLLKVLPAILDYDESVVLEHKKDSANIEKVLVQEIPHLPDGRLVFEPDEAAEMHSGAVGMLKSAKTIRVLTTYAHVDAISSNADLGDVDDKLNRMEQNIFAKAGVSGQIFAPTGSSSLPTALENDLAIMMQLANKFSLFISTLINSLFGNSNISFAYKIMPISYYNTKDVIEDSYKLVSSGYSFLVPALAQGFTQKELIGVKDLENDLLKLNEKLIPLSTAYTQSAASQKNESNSGDNPKNDEGANKNTGNVKPIQTDDGGRPSLPVEKKSGKTIQNIEGKK